MASDFISFIRKGDEPSAEVSQEERNSDEGLEVDRDRVASSIVPVPGVLEIKEQTSNEPLNAKYPKVNGALETPGQTRSSCHTTDTDSRVRDQLITHLNEKISVSLRQTETDAIRQAHFLDSEAEPEWITKIKTFKISLGLDVKNMFLTYNATVVKR